MSPLERGYGGPIAMLVGIDTKGVLTGVVVGEHHEPYGDFSIDRPAVRRAVQGQGRPRPVQARRGHRRGVARHDHDVERGPRDPQQRPARGARSSSRRRRNEPWLLLVALLVAGVLRAVPSLSAPARCTSASRRAAGGWDFDGRRRGGADLGRRHPRAGGRYRRRRRRSSSLAFVSFFRKSVRLKYVTLVVAVVYLGLLQEPADLDRQHLRPVRRQPADLQLQPGLVPARRRHGRLDGAVGPRLLRPHLRVRRADAADGRVRAASAGASTCRSAIERRAVAGSSTASSAAPSSTSSSPAIR